MIRQELDSLAHFNPDSALQLVDRYNQLDLGLFIEQGGNLNQELLEIKLVAFETLGKHDSVAQLINDMATAYMEAQDTFPVVGLLQRVYYDALSYPYFVAMESHLRSGIQFLEPLQDQYLEQLVGLQLQLAIVLIEKNDFIEAQELLEQAISYSSSVNYQAGFIDIYQVLAEMHFKQGELEQARDDYKKSLAMIQVAGDDMDNYVATLSNLGVAYRQLEQYDSARICYQTILDTIPEDALLTRLKNTLNLGNVFYDQGLLEEATQLYESVVQSSRKNDLPVGVIYGKANLSGVLQKQGAYREAIDLLIPLLQAAEELGSPELLFEINAKLEKLYQLTGQYKEAYAQKELVMLYQDSIKSANNKLLLNDLEYFMAKSRLALENQILAAKVQKRNQWNLLLGLLLLAGILLAGLSYWNYLQTRKATKLYQTLLKERDVAIAEKEQLYEFLLQEERQKSQLFAHKVASLSQELVEKVLMVDEWDSKAFWVNYTLKFRSLYPDFEHQLREMYPKLSTQDIQYLKLVKLDLPIDVILKVLNVVPNSLYKKKQRIIERMGLSGLEDVNLLDYLPD